jgi:hypothetical protein
MSIASTRLKDVKPGESDLEIAQRCALVLIEHDPEAFWFAIDHDVRSAAARRGGPRTGRPPVEYTWANKGQIGIDTRTPGVAMHWIIQALMAGYTVHRCDRNKQPTGISYSISRVRTTAAFHQRPNPDDDIPF